MATVHYFLRISKNTVRATIRCRFHPSRKLDSYGITKFDIPVCVWDKKKERIKKFDDCFNYETAQHINNFLDELDTFILKEYNLENETNFSKEWVQMKIDVFTNQREGQPEPILQPKEVKHFSIIEDKNILIELKDESVDKSEIKSLENLNDYIDRYVKEMNSGKRKKTDGTFFAKGTIKNKESFQTEFNKFQVHKGRKYNFDDIDMEMYGDFIDFFNEKEYSPNTTGKHIKSLKEIMKAAMLEKLHTNLIPMQKAFKILSCPADTISLTDEDVEAIEKIDLSKNKDLDEVRDVFLVGVYTLQRFSDYHRIGEINVISLKNRKKAVSLIQQKTDKRVVIPCSPKLLAILKKYDNNLPYVYSQKLNENIKLICRMAKITQKVSIQMIKGGKKKILVFDKCSLVTTHTARRTGCTLMYLAGFDILSIMKLSGHTTEKEFLKYIRVSEEENAIRLSTDEYFNKLVCA